MERTKEWITNMSKSPQNGVTDFIICLKPDLTPIGKIGVWQDQEIGFLVSRKHWRKGLAKEALDAILPYLFGRGVERLVADIDPRNDASKGILKVMGFEEGELVKGTAVIGGETVDSLYLYLSRERWEERRSRAS
jgi:[ribosomal protein S5]-alanine N-acetyltransferase